MYTGALWETGRGGGCGDCVGYAGAISANSRGTSGLAKGGGCDECVCVLWCIMSK